MADERDQAPATWGGRLKGVLALKILLALWGLAALYWISYLAISRSATYVHETSFWGQERAVSVRIGSLHLSVGGYEGFMGTVFHPVLLKLAAIPLVVLVLLLFSLAALAVWGYFEGEKAQQEGKAALAASREHELKKVAINADKVKVHLAGEKLVGRCSSCNQNVVFDSKSDCPNCGASPGS